MLHLTKRSLSCFLFLAVPAMLLGQGERATITGTVTDAAPALGGWEFSRISVFQSGRPILIIGPDQTNLYNFSSTNGSSNRLKSAVLSSGQTDNHWFDTTAFAAAGPVHGADRFAQSAESPFAAAHQYRFLAD